MRDGTFGRRCRLRFLSGAMVMVGASAAIAPARPESSRYSASGWFSGRARSNASSARQAVLIARMRG